MRVLISGASGLIGTALVEHLREGGHEVTKLVRRRPAAPDEVNWAPSARTIDFRVMDETDAVINLSGATVGRLPWTRPYRRTLRDSRIQTTQALAEAMNMASNPPRVFLSASAVGFYGDRPAQRLTEDSSRGEGFFAELVDEWESAARLAPRSTRVVHLRSGVVIDRGGALAPVRLLTALGLGSRLGTGGQHWAWISLRDEVAAIAHLLDASISGPVNLVAPTPATSDRITQAVARRMRRPYLLRAPEFALRLLLGEGGQLLLLDSQKVLPQRLSNDGFSWSHPRVEQAIDAALGP